MAMADPTTGTGDPKAYAMQYLMRQGYDPVHAAAMVGHMVQESGVDPTNVNRKEDAHGLLQWRLDRWKGLQDFAKSKGTSPQDMNTQLDFIGREMNGPEAKAGQGFMAAQDLPSASAALKRYIRFGDNYDSTRLANAAQLLPSSSPVPAPPPASPMGTLAGDAVPAGGSASLSSPAGMLSGMPAQPYQPQMFGDGANQDLDEQLAGVPGLLNQNMQNEAPQVAPLSPIAMPEPPGLMRARISNMMNNPAVQLRQRLLAALAPGNQTAAG